LTNEKKPEYVPPPRSEIEFWRVTGESWISSSLSQLDERAKWMVTFAAGITVADSTLLQILKSVSVVTVTPNLFFSLGVLFFVCSLFPREYTVSPYMTEKMRDTYSNILHSKLRWHKLGFVAFFIGLLFVIISTLF
jgi:hypothetical protein